MVIYLNWKHLHPFTRLVVVASLLFIVPIGFYILSLVIEKKTREITREQRKAEKETLEEYINKIYIEERMQYYQDAHYLFNRLMKAGALNRADILKLKKMINAALGRYDLEYEDKKYKNDAHEIYSKMKDKRIDEKEWIKIIEYMTLKAS